MRRWCWLVVVAACGEGEFHWIPDAGPDAAPRCSVVEQDCGAGQKCTMPTVPSNGAAPACSPAGPVAIDAACSGSSGEDDCGAGGYCTYAGVLPPQNGGASYCRTLCEADMHCPSGQRCTPLGIEPANFTPVGFCAPTCAAFGACPSGMTCGDHLPSITGPSDLLLACRPSGAVPVGGTCQGNLRCVPDSVCINMGCRALCDATHPCASGTCNMRFGTAGVCL
ncbi:MAG: hypothetical protein JNL83_28360 [Myxococcales bacterium]|nr:hypothetical protein [Myxococcales bacterium]